MLVGKVLLGSGDLCTADVVLREKFYVWVGHLASLF